MKKKFVLTFFYTSYLIMLGQGCSVLDTDDSGLVLKLPELTMPTAVSMPKVPAIKVSTVELKAPKEEVKIEKEVVEKKPVSKVELSPYKDSAYRVSSDLPLDNLKVKKNDNRLIAKVTLPIPKTISLASVLEENNLKQIKPISIEEVKATDKKTTLKIVREVSLDNKKGFQHYGFKYEVPVELVSTGWMNQQILGLDERLAEVEKASTEIKTLSAPLKEAIAYQPNAIESFVNDENDFSDIVKKKESSIVKNDELVFLDYSKAKQAPQVAKENLKLAATSLVETQPLPVKRENNISNVVRRVIDREMAGKTPKYDPSRMMAMAAASKQGNSSIDSLAKKIFNNSSEKTSKSSKKNRNLQNQATLYAIESNLKTGFKDSVENFDFIPSHDPNNTLRDFNEGSITVDYSLVNQTGLLRGTIIKNFYMRTTFEIPLGSEYSKFEIPLIPKDSLGDYLDENKLEGYGGFYLVDLGDLIEDVDVEKTSNDKYSPYEHRLLLNEDFVPVKDGSSYRYVLFIGVVPGSLNVRYLGVNGQETSKLTFITADEITYDFSQIERPHLLSFTTRVRNTLGTSTSPLNLSVDKITSFLDEVNPIKTSDSSYEIKVPWSVKGMRNYYRFDYLEDDIFVGVDRDQNIELPSKEFIGEILKSFNMDSLGAECVLQMNFSQEVREIQIQAESEKGPANFDHTYLDRDGVFTPEISSLSEKFFAIGYEEGIFSIKVMYEDGRNDYLRTYCSPSTYLLEQL